MEYQEWLEKLTLIHIPRYDELPAIPLYSDQVLEYVEGVFFDLYAGKKNFITAAMINNYVKQKLMPAPLKKRYNKDHLAFIVTITILKQVISIPDITLGIKTVRQHYGKARAYDIFAEVVEKEIKSILAMVSQDHISIQNQDYETDPVILPIKAASLAFIGKILAERSLEEQLKGAKKNG